MAFIKVLIPWYFPWDQIRPAGWWAPAWFAAPRCRLQLRRQTCNMKLFPFCFVRYQFSTSETSELSFLGQVVACIYISHANLPLSSFFFYYFRSANINSTQTLWTNHETGIMQTLDCHKKNFSVPGPTDGVNFIEEDETRLLCPRHLEQLSDHPCTFTNIPEIIIKKIIVHENH